MATRDTILSPVLAHVLCAILFALAGWIVWHTPVVTDISAFLPGPANRTQALLASQLRDGVASRVLLVGIEAGAADDASDASAGGAAELAALSVALARALRADARFEAVANGDAASAEAVRRVVTERRYMLSPRINADSFTADGLRAALNELARTMQSSMAPVVKTIAAQDPTLELLHLAERFADRLQPPTRHGVWFSADQRTALLVVQTRAPGYDVDGQQAAVAALREAFASAASQQPAARTGPQLLVTGPGAFAAESRAAIEGDATRLSLLAAGSIALLLLVALRRPMFLPLAAVPVLAGVLAGFAAAAWAYGSIHGITIGFGVTLIGEAVDYAIYVFVQRSASGSDTRLWRSLWLAVLTSSIGFAAMVLSGFQGLAQLGLFSIVGIVAAGLVARWILPTWLPAARVPGASESAPIARLLDSAPRIRIPIVVLALVLGTVLAARGQQLWNDDLGALSPLPRHAGELDHRLRTELGLPDLRMLLAIDGAHLDEALLRAERTQPLLDALQRDGMLQGYDSPAVWLPSRAAQAARRAALPDADTLRANLARAAAASPFNAAAFEPFIAAVQRERAAGPIGPQTYDATPIAQLLASQIVADGERATVLVAVRGVADPVALRARLEAAALPGLVVLDLKADVERLIGQYRQRALVAASAGAAMIVALLGWRLRGRRVAARIALALACAVTIAAGAMVLLDGHLTLFHLVALLLVVGIGSNYALFFATLPDAAAERSAVRASVLLCAASTFVAFVLLAASSAPVLHIIGLTVGLGTLASLVSSAAIAGQRRSAHDEAAEPSTV